VDADDVIKGLGGKLRATRDTVSNCEVELPPPVQP
jgi:hypothetical protein